MSLPVFVSPVVFSATTYYPCMHSCKMIENTIDIWHFLNWSMLFCLPVQLPLQFMHIIILHKFWTSHKHISNYPKIPCISNIFMRFVAYGIRLVWTKEFFIEQKSFSFKKTTSLPLELTAWLVLLVFSQARYNGQIYSTWSFLSIFPLQQFNIFLILSTNEN